MKRFDLLIDHRVDKTYIYTCYSTNKNKRLSNGSTY